MSEPTPKCTTCGRNPDRMNSNVAECSHIECPSRKPVTADATWQQLYVPNRIRTSDGDTQ